MDIKWESPAPIERKKTANELIFEKLMERPGEWARIKNAKTEKAAYAGCFVIKKEAKKLGGHWEFTARKLKNNNGAIYARYLGDDSFHADQTFAEQGFVVTV